jgi:hypothetical protein
MSARPLNCFALFDPATGRGIEGATVLPHFSAIGSVDAHPDDLVPMVLVAVSCGRSPELAKDESHRFCFWHHWENL